MLICFSRAFLPSFTGLPVTVTMKKLIQNKMNLNLIKQIFQCIFFNPRTRRSVNCIDLVFWGPSDPKIKMKNKLFNL